MNERTEVLAKFAFESIKIKPVLMY